MHGGVKNQAIGIVLGPFPGRFAGARRGDDLIYTGPGTA